MHPLETLTIWKRCLFNPMSSMQKVEQLFTMLSWKLWMLLAFFVMILFFFLFRVVTVVVILLNESFKSDVKVYPSFLHHINISFFSFFFSFFNSNFLRGANISCFIILLLILLLLLLLLLLLMFWVVLHDEDLIRSISFKSWLITRGWWENNSFSFLCNFVKCLYFFGK